MGNRRERQGAALWTQLWDLSVHSGTEQLPRLGLRVCLSPGARRACRQTPGTRRLQAPPPEREQEAPRLALSRLTPTRMELLSKSQEYQVSACVYTIPVYMRRNWKAVNHK